MVEGADLVALQHRQQGGLQPVPVGGAQPDQPVEDPLDRQRRPAPAEQRRHLLDQLVHLDDRGRDGRRRRRGRQLVAGHRHRDGGDRPVPVPLRQRHRPVPQVRRRVFGGHRERGGDLRRPVRLLPGELVQPGQLRPHQRLLRPGQHRPGGVQQGLQLHRVTRVAQRPQRRRGDRPRPVGEQPQVRARPRRHLLRGRRQQVVQGQERAQRDRPVPAQQPTEDPVQQDRPVDPPLRRQRGQGPGRRLPVAAERQVGSDAVHLEQPGQQHVQERVGAQPVEQGWLLLAGGPLPPHRVRPAGDERVPGRRRRLLRQQEPRREVPASPRLAAAHPVGQLVRQVGQPGHAPLPGHGDHRLRVGVPQHDRPPAEQRRRLRRGAERADGRHRQRGRLLPPPPVVAPPPDVGDQFVAERPAGRLVQPVQHRPDGAHVAPDQGLEEVRHAPTSAGAATIDTARACLQGPRCPRCRPHHRQEQVYAPSGSRRTR